jgi:hypothetical protein
MNFTTMNDTIINSNTIITTTDYTSADIAAAAALLTVVLSGFNTGLKLWKRFWNWKNPGKPDPLQPVENLANDINQFENDIVKPPTTAENATKQ